MRYIEKIIPKIKEEEKDLMSRMITMIFEEKIGKEKSKKYKIINNKQTLIKVVLELLLSNFATKSSLQI